MKVVTKKHVPPAKKRYSEKNPTVSITLTRSDGIQQFVEFWRLEHKLNSQGEAVKDIVKTAWKVYIKKIKEERQQREQALNETS